ncbi:replication endonuclease [Massilia sp. Leaf139]|uniref:replication endonuclease n=1 Tax=Massilia sp. Leaf139 TaxID=1736272 RepID=UPI00138F625F|nr:replication endonuclease [Massilia sp. Leaf139]
MAKAMYGVFQRDGQEAHQPKVDLIDRLLLDDDRIPLATDTGAITGAAAIWHAAERAVRYVHEHCLSLQTMDAILAAVGVECARRGIEAPKGDTEQEQIARAVDKAWWRRHLRTEWKRRFEHVSIQLGLTSVRNDPYVSRESALLQEAQNRANRQLLEQRIATNEHGQSYTVAELADKGMANKTLRRGELMTRIRGFEECADSRGDVGMFWTITCPSKFHSVGGANPNYNGATPRQAQAYLVEVYALIRSALHRVGIRPYGFRIAEPHSDGCPHWHMLLFVAPEHAERMEAIVRHYALAEDGDEKGAQKNRVKLVRIEAGKGTAAGYIAKYVSKNIDGAGVGDHKTFENGTTYVIAPDVFGDVEITPSARVTYWSQVWGIRQFQQIGGAPVGVWRELRRIKAETIQGAPEAIKAAHAACQKIESEDAAVAKQASFADYLNAQGGPTVERRKLAVRIAARPVTIKGRYATYEDDKPAGVYASAFPNEVYESVRYRWTIEAADGAGVALGSPWTGVNKCTGEPEFSGRPSRGMSMENRGDGRTAGAGWSFDADKARDERFKELSPRFAPMRQGAHLNELRRKYE